MPVPGEVTMQAGLACEQALLEYIRSIQSCYTLLTGGECIGAHYWQEVNALGHITDRRLSALGDI